VEWRNTGGLPLLVYFNDIIVILGCSGLPWSCAVSHLFCPAPPKGALGSVDIHMRARKAVTRWIAAAKLASVLS
jgi:hypothetical protein